MCIFGYLCWNPVDISGGNDFDASSYMILGREDYPLDGVTESPLWERSLLGEKGNQRNVAIPLRCYDIIDVIKKKKEISGRWSRF